MRARIVFRRRKLSSIFTMYAPWVYCQHRDKRRKGIKSPFHVSGINNEWLTTWVLNIPQFFSPVEGRTKGKKLPGKRVRVERRKGEHNENNMSLIISVNVLWGSFRTREILCHCSFSNFVLMADDDSDCWVVGECSREVRFNATRGIAS